MRKERNLLRKNWSYLRAEISKIIAEKEFLTPTFDHYLFTTIGNKKKRKYIIHSVNCHILLKDPSGYG